MKAMRARPVVVSCVLAGMCCAWWTASLGAPDTPVDPITFDDIASRAGVDLVVRNSATPNKHQIETMIAGVAVFDYNNDGRPDIYFVNGAGIPGLEKTGPGFYNALYRNNSDGTFTNVTAQAGVPGAGYGMGVAAGDYDNDGHVDLFLPGLNRNFLYRNRGDGTFEDATKRAGLEGLDPKRGKLWAIAAGWFDYDNDGLLDLFVVNYCVWKPEQEPYCGDMQAGYRTYCHPKHYKALPNNLYRNNGDGTFTDVSEASGIAAHLGKGMGVAFADYDQDGDLDVFVANDTEPNFLFRNEGAGKFVEIGMRAGVAYNNDGRAVSSMGADFRDLDNDGREDLFVAALANETFPLFRPRLLQRHDVSEPGRPPHAACQRLEQRHLRFQQRRLEGSVCRRRRRAGQHRAVLQPQVPPAEPAAGQHGQRRVRRLRQAGWAGPPTAGAPPRRGFRRLRRRWQGGRRGHAPQ